MLTVPPFLSVENHSIKNLLGNPDQGFLVKIGELVAEHLNDVVVTDVHFVTEEGYGKDNFTRVLKDSLVVKTLSFKEGMEVGCEFFRIYSHQDLKVFVHTVCEDYESFWFLVPSH